MLTKVCGMKLPDNAREVVALGIDWMGFIFYPKSPRSVHAVDDRTREALTACPVRRVGVFVNASPEEMRETAEKWRLDLLQLHGDETPETCHALQKRGYALIKAFPVASADDLERTRAYEGRVDYFLFDTRCDGYGGSGKTFDWSLLERYAGETPFLLSGGIRPESLDALRHLSHPRWAGIDLNSGFESAPGIKDIPRLRTFLRAFHPTQPIQQ